MQTRSKPKKRRLPAAARADMQRTKQIARNEMAIGLMSIFRPLPDGALRHEIQIEQRFAGGMVRVMGVEMSQFEQSVFLALLEIAGRALGCNLQTALAAGLLPELPHPNAPGAVTSGENAAAEAQTMEVKTTLAEICRAAGLSDKPGSGTRSALKLAFQRLAGVTVYAEGADGVWGITHLMSGAIGLGGDEGSVIVRLNPRSTAAAMGGRSYAPVSMVTYRALPTPTVRVLYAWLCAWFTGRTGTRVISMDALEAHVFGAIARDRRRRSQRRGQIRAALIAVARRDALFQIKLVSDCAEISRSFDPPKAASIRPAADTDTPSGGRSHSQKSPIQVAPTSRGRNAASQQLGSLPNPQPP